MSNLTRIANAAVALFCAHEWTSRHEPHRLYLECMKCGRVTPGIEHPLAIAIRNQVIVADRPYVKPLASLLDFYGGYGVILVDKQGARLFSFHLGELTEQEGILGDHVRHTKRGGASAKPGMRGGIAGQTRYEDEVTDRNFRAIADFASHFFAENKVRRVLIGGTDENLAILRGQLPKSWQSLIVGTFPMSMTASADDVLARALEIGEASQHDEAQRQYNSILKDLEEQARVLLTALSQLFNAQPKLTVDEFAALPYRICRSTTS